MARIQKVRADSTTDSYPPGKIRADLFVSTMNGATMIQIEN